MKKSIILLIVAMLMCGLSSNAFSWGGHYRYDRGRYYRDAGWWGVGGLVTGLAIGAYVSSLPPQYDTVVVSGVPYYYSDGYYYQTGPNGYVVVTPPTSQVQTQGQAQGQTAPTQNNTMVYILGTLFGILLLLCIGLSFKKLMVRTTGKPA